MRDVAERTLSKASSHDEGKHRVTSRRPQVADDRTAVGLAGRLLQVGDAQRRRLARDLHDTTMQNLAAALMVADELREPLCRSGRGQYESMESLKALIGRSLDELKRISKLLHPPLLEEIGLVSSLRSLVREFEMRSGITVAFSVENSNKGGRDASVETTLFHVVQEALANVDRHSGSATATVRLIRTSHDTLVEIADEGMGIPDRLAGDLSDIPCHGIGIASMRARVSSLGGELRITSDALGTRVRALVPSQITRDTTISSPGTPPLEEMNLVGPGNDEAVAGCEDEANRLDADLRALRAISERLRERSQELRVAVVRNSPIRQALRKRDNRAQATLPTSRN
jgi:signal transduction histidine kinase